jgi:hypothetical protein
MCPISSPIMEAEYTVKEAAMKKHSKQVSKLGLSRETLGELRLQQVKGGINDPTLMPTWCVDYTYFSYIATCNCSTAAC